jgi:hypothetical protein
MKAKATTKLRPSTDDDRLYADTHIHHSFAVGLSIYMTISYSLCWNLSVSAEMTLCRNGTDIPAFLVERYSSAMISTTDSRMLPLLQSRMIL